MKTYTREEAIVYMVQNPGKAILKDGKYKEGVYRWNPDQGRIEVKHGNEWYGAQVMEQGVFTEFILVDSNSDFVKEFVAIWDKTSGTNYATKTAKLIEEMVIKANELLETKINGNIIASMHGFKPGEE